MTEIDSLRTTYAAAGVDIAAGQQAVACTPGASVTLGCGCGSVGTCANDPVLRVCDGGDACIAANALASVDDTCGYCPQTTFVCPASGVYTDAATSSCRSHNS